MSPIEQYIKERISLAESCLIKDEIEHNYPIFCRIEELQAVLSKLEEIEKPMGHTATIKKVYPDGSFEVYTAGDDTLQELNK